MVMKKIICMLSMASILSVGVVDVSQAHGRWSHRKKGAVIGAGAGALSGALLNHEHRAGGALVGGAVGAGVGYLIGRHADRKRYYPEHTVVYRTRRAHY
jgi:hypothetical protein